MQSLLLSMSDNRVVVFLWLKEKKIGSDWAIYFDQPIFKGQLTKKLWKKRLFEVEIQEICESEEEAGGTFNVFLILNFLFFVCCIRFVSINFM